MSEERMALSTKERDRLKVLHGVMKRQISQREGAEQLGLTERWVRKLVRRLRKRGDRAVIHGLRGRSSNRKISDADRRRALRTVRSEYADFGPTLAAEYLAEEHGLEVSRETLRKWMIEAGLWKRRRQRVCEVHLWRPRRSCPGELVQWDTSEHDWLEGRGPQMYLVAMVDDATSRAWARFVAQDSTEQNMGVLWGYLERYGRPVAFYTDKASMFQTNRRSELEEELSDRVPKTQIGRALEELGIGWIAAHSPQAKGRIERFFQTCQDRLVKGLRKAGATTLEQANQYLDNRFLPLWERQFTVEPTNPSDAHRPLGREHDLAAILSHVEKRVVAADYTIRWSGQIYQVGRAAIRPGLRGTTVWVEKRLDGSLVVRFRDHYLPVTACAPAPKRQPRIEPRPEIRRSANATRSTWMQNFHLKQAPPIWRAIES